MLTISTELQIPQGTQLFHYSREPSRLVSSGAFNPQLSAHRGAAFLTLDRTDRSNCVAKADKPLRVFDYTKLPISEEEALGEAYEGDWWEGAADMGYDGRVFDNPDQYCRMPNGLYTTEVVIFRNSLIKLVDIRQL